MRVLICGDRHWDDYQTMAIIVRGLKKDTVVVQGGAPGADRMAGGFAKARGLVVEEHMANWDKYGRAAGPIRNKEMLRSGVDLVIACHNDLSSSKGTKNMVEQAIKAGVKVIKVGCS